ncbi:MAG: methyltransferase domain-containing protein [Polyangiaceae bacterium]|nr:methyltransferase domain-containing protein [Polyangiaceae bacterium]
MELLERHHGVGARAGGAPAWMLERLDRALDALATGAAGGAVEVGERLERDRDALAELAESLRVGETCFYRDPPAWDALRAAWRPGVVRGDGARALSVGCSTGEEAWTLAMVLEEACGGRGARVVALDRSRPALAVARAGTYPREAARHLPADLGARYLVSDAADHVRVVDSLRRTVAFVERDATSGLPPGAWDLVVCRNVLIYFGDDAGAALVRALGAALAPGGALLVARSEVARVRALGLAARELAPGVVVFG